MHRGKLALADEYMWRWLQLSRTRGEDCSIRKILKEIVMTEKKTWNRAVKNDHFDLLVGFNCRDDLVELWNRVRAKDVEPRMINRHAPIRGRLAGQKDLFVAHNI